MKVGGREFVETVCVFCDMTFFVPKGMEKDYVCLDCRDHFRNEMIKGYDPGTEQGDITSYTRLCHE